MSPKWTPGSRSITSVPPIRVLVPNEVLLYLVVSCSYSPPNLFVTVLKGETPREEMARVIVRDINEDSRFTNNPRAYLTRPPGRIGLNLTLLPHSYRFSTWVLIHFGFFESMLPRAVGVIPLRTETLGPESSTYNPSPC
jgi:hypothetical protein